MISVCGHIRELPIRGLKVITNVTCKFRGGFLEKIMFKLSPDGRRQIMLVRETGEGDRSPI
jgi:hypothetical protein